MIGTGISVSGLGLLSSGSIPFTIKPQKMFLALALGAGAASFLLGYASAQTQVFNYVEIESGQGKKVGALLGASASGIFLLEDYDWRDISIGTKYSIIFLPNSSFDQISSLPRRIKVYGDTY